MATYTFSFLIVHYLFQDTITYEIGPDYIFEDVIAHVCTSFGFHRHDAMIQSALGFEVSEFQKSVPEIVDKYGLYFKMIVNERPKSQFSPSETTMDIESSDNEEVLLEQPVTLGSGDEEWSNLKPIDDTINQQESEESDIFHDVMEDLLNINAENWQIDEEGNVEITIIPNYDNYITQLKIKSSAAKSSIQLFQQIARTLGTSLDRILITPMQEDAQIITELEFSVEQLLEKHGAIFVLYPIELRKELELESDLASQKLRELIFKYKRR